MDCCDDDVVLDFGRCVRHNGGLVEDCWRADNGEAVRIAGRFCCCDEAILETGESLDLSWSIPVISDGCGPIAGGIGDDDWYDVDEFGRGFGVSVISR